jgi:peptide/nickel transport system substrate-binding protein
MNERRNNSSRTRISRNALRFEEEKMGNTTKKIVFVTLVILALFVLQGCQQATETPGMEPETPTEAPSQPDPTAVPDVPPPEEKTVVILGSWAESPNLNPYYLSGPESGSFMTVEGLLAISVDGTYTANLITEVPTSDNGGLSADGLTVTYHLIDGLVWSDGEPVTSEDIRFTWEAILNPNNAVVKTLGHERIVSVDTPDELTAVVTLDGPYVAYLTLFPALLPEHVLGDMESMDNADYNRAPIGTGPYRVVDWVSGSHIELEPNPNYRFEGKPNIDSVFIKWLPSREAGLAQIVTGEIDVLEDITVAELEGLENTPGLTIEMLPSLASERLFLNLSDESDPSVPHPVLGELAVRQALDYAIDRGAIIDGLLDGRATPAPADLPSGQFGDETIVPTVYDPAKAKELLDEAGWVVGDDGIRSKDGVRMSLTISISSGNQLRELTEQLLQEMFADVGVELIIENKESGQFWGSYAEGGIRFLGDFDILLYTTGPGVTGSFVDPHAHMVSYYHSANIPWEGTDFSGGNYMRFANDVVDAALDEAGSVPEVALRQAAYSRAMNVIAEEKPMLFLYNRVQMHVFSDSVKGWTENVWLAQISSWDIANWTVE